MKTVCLHGLNAIFIPDSSDEEIATTILSYLITSLIFLASCLFVAFISKNFGQSPEVCAAYCPKRYHRYSEKLGRAYSEQKATNNEVVENASVAVRVRQITDMAAMASIQKLNLRNLSFW